MTENQRPDPDRLLADVAKQEATARRGRLKIFFGMAAGVGKTYAMLEEARSRAAEGVDVLVGYAEPHIRSETESLLLGMEILPYRIVEYRNAKLKEFDVDAALAKKPTLVLVDELAHTNAPGMRHAKRWQDVIELLDAGINVYTTVNVQHLESVNDIVERITGVRVRETLPDAVLEAADEVELVDIAPEELLERFREGKIYRPEQAERAAKHFFTKGNLIALRELALRKTAQRVDVQMQEARRASGARSTWAASERVLVCVGPSPMSARLVRAAKRLADSLRAEWVAVSVQTPKSPRTSERDRQRLDQTLRLAEQLGARCVTLTGQRVADEVIAYAQANNVTKIVVGKPATSRWHDLWHGSVVDDLVRGSGQIDLHVIRGGDTDADPAPAPSVQRTEKWDWIGIGWATGLVALATAVGWPLYHAWGLSNTNILMFYLLAVLWVATHHSRAAAITASVLGVAAFDLTFVPPYYAFTVEDREYVVTFIVMLVTALVISALTIRVRSQAQLARDRQTRTAALLTLSRDLSAMRSTDEIAAATAKHVGSVFGHKAIVLLPDAERRLTIAGQSHAEAIDPKEMGVAQWAFEHGQIAGKQTATLPAAAGVYLPLRASRQAVGVLGLITDASAGPMGTDQRQFAEAFASQAALALERAELADEARQAWERVEAEFLRNTLLSGVSHELRTPLAAITGSASALGENGASLDESARGELVDAIISESDRMERMIENLLDMTRMEAGGLVLRREWQPLNEVVGSALHHLDRRLKGREVAVDVPGDLPMVQIDSSGIEQVLVNLIDNAAEYTPAGSPLEIAARATGAEVVVEVADRGPGLPPGTEKRVFDKFFRGHPAEHASRRGVGLGLAICRGIVEAHGGTISASNRPGGGAVFRFTIPSTGSPPAVDTSA